MRYVCGFLFYRDTVVLIRKARPEWQRGRLNGVGGKVEPHEHPDDAMAREFREETGIQEHIVWKRFCELKVLGGSVFFYRAFVNKWRRMRPEKDSGEEPFRYKVSEVLESDKLIDNLKYLIPMALDKNRPVAKVEETE